MNPVIDADTVVVIDAIEDVDADTDRESTLE